MVDCRPGSNIYIPNEKPNGIEPFLPIYSMCWQDSHTWAPDIQEDCKIPTSMLIILSNSRP